MGSAALIERSVKSLMETAPNDFRAMAADPEWQTLGLRAFKTRLENAERDAVRLWFEAQGWVGGHETKMLLVWLSAQGVTDPELARSMIALGKRALDASETDAYRLAKSLVRARVMADPDERRRAAQEIFGLMDVTEAMPALPHANGNGASSHSDASGSPNGHL